MGLGVLVRWVYGPLGLDHPEFESPNGPFFKRPTSETSSLKRICWVCQLERGVVSVGEGVFFFILILIRSIILLEIMGERDGKIFIFSAK